MLGVGIASLDDWLRSCFDAKEANGAVVISLMPDGPARDAGLQPGDIIQELDGNAVASARGLVEFVAAEPAGVTVKLDVLRTSTLTEVVQRLKDPAGATDAAAMACLGYFRECGMGVEKDVAEANRWYRKAADTGHVHAIAKLGVMYAPGRGVAQDRRAAARHMFDALRLRDPSAGHPLFFIPIWHPLSIGTRGYRFRTVHSVLTRKSQFGFLLRAQAMAGSTRLSPRVPLRLRVYHASHQRQAS